MRQGDNICLSDAIHSFIRLFLHKQSHNVPVNKRRMRHKRGLSYLDGPAALFERVQLTPRVEHARRGRVGVAPFTSRQRAFQSERRQDNWKLKRNIVISMFQFEMLLPNLELFELGSLGTLAPHHNTQPITNWRKQFFTSVDQSLIDWTTVALATSATTISYTNSFP